MNFAEQFRKIRVQKNIKQSEIANYLSVNQPAISNWESGRTEPDITTVVKLANYMNVTTDELLGLVTKPQKNPENQIYYKSKIYQEIWDKLSTLEENEVYKVDGFIEGLFERKKSNNIQSDKNTIERKGVNL